MEKKKTDKKPKKTDASKKTKAKDEGKASWFAFKTKKQEKPTAEKEKKRPEKSKQPAKLSWPIKSRTTLIVGGLVFGLIIGLVVTSSGITGAAVSQGDLTAQLIEMFPQIDITEVEDLDQFYMVSYTAQGAPGVFYVTADGNYMLVGQVIDLNELAASKEAEESAGTDAAPAPEVPKSDRPKVEVFVMSYCPYGLQMEKAVLSVQDLLKDSADVSIKFVHYIMHGEKEATENTRHYCMQKEEPENFWAYLTCFIDKGEGQEQACMDAAGIDSTAIDSCIAKATTDFKIDEDLASGEQFPRYRVDAEASEGYGVRGSPALVINGQLVDASRTPEGIKTAICNAFTTAPAECDTALSTTGPTPGFGLTGAATTGASAGTCG